MSSTTAMSYLNSKICLISRALIRYEGTLVSINTDDQTVGLSNVRCFGTEDRVIGSEAVPASNDIFEFVLFQGKQIKDITVSELAGPDDPAIVSINRSSGRQQQIPNISTQAGSGLSADAAAQMMHHHSVSGLNQGGGRINDQGHCHPAYNMNQQNIQGSLQMMGGLLLGHTPHYSGSNNTANHPSNMYGMNGRFQNDTMNYSSSHGNGAGNFDYNTGRIRRKGNQYMFYGDNNMYSMTNHRNDNSNYNYHRNPYRHSQRVIGELNPQPNSALKSSVEAAFNFEEANLKFDKSAVELEQDTNTAEGATKEVTEQKAASNALPAKPMYDIKSSFFDNISCDTLDRQAGTNTKIDRSKQRQIDIETFGSTARQTRIGRMNGRMPHMTGGMGNYFRRGVYNNSNVMVSDRHMMEMNQNYSQIGSVPLYNKMSVTRY